MVEEVGMQLVVPKHLHILIALITVTSGKWNKTISMTCLP